METTSRQVEVFGRSGGIGAWLLAALAVLAVAAVAFRVWTGRRPESEQAVDVHAMNGELVERESALAERIRVLDPERAEYARRTIRRDAREAERALAELPPDDGVDRLAQARALSRFRIDSESLVIEVSNAVAAVSSARAAAILAASAAKTAEREFSDTVEPGLDDWLRKVKTAADELAGWRAQRLAKMENREFVTFPAFYATASDSYRGWENGADTASEIRNLLFDDLLPRAESAASNLANRVSDIRRESARAATASATLRGLPVDSGLFDSARNGALSAYEKTVQGAKQALSGIERWADAFPEKERKSIQGLRSRSDRLEKSAGEASSSLPASVADAVSAAVRTGRGTAVEGWLSEFETGWDSLRRDWSALDGRIREGDDAVVRIRNARRKDEAEVVADLIVLETSRGFVNGVSVERRCAGLEALRAKIEQGLADAERRIEEADVARWKGEREGIRNVLVQLKNTWAKPAAPGWTRPAKETDALLRSISELLASLDSWPESKVRSEQTSIMKRSKDLESRVSWTPGARHPDKPHIFAAVEDGKNVWDADPGYWFDNPGENSDLMVSWRPGNRHPDHPHISAGPQEGTWVPDPGYKARWSGDLDPVWTIGTRHPTRAHVFASLQNGKEVWDCDPGYVWVEPNSHNLDCRWSPGRRHPDHPHISAGQIEGTWVPDPGYKARWNGDLDPRWTAGTRHPTKPHVFATDEERTWDADPGYWFVNPGKGSDLTVVWTPGRAHPSYRGLVSAEQEGQWKTNAGWSFVNPGTSDLRTKWNPGCRLQNWPHVHASETEGQWNPDEGYSWVSTANDGDFSVQWTPGKVSSDGMRRAKQREGQFETKRRCGACTNGWKTKTERCPGCRGTGKVAFGLPCPKCNGNKRIQTRSICTRCNGTGSYWP